MIQIECGSYRHARHRPITLSASLSPTESMSIDSNCHTMNQESALDVVEPQSLTDDPVMLHGNDHSTTLVPTDSVATDTSCCTMDQEPTVDDHEPQYLSKDPVILCGDDICGSLAPTEPAAADTGCPPPWIKSQQLSTISHRFLRILCCCPKRMLPFRIVSTILDDLLTIYAIYYNYNFISSVNQYQCRLWYFNTRCSASFGMPMG